MHENDPALGGTRRAPFLRGVPVEFGILVGALEVTMVPQPLQGSGAIRFE